MELTGKQKEILHMRYNLKMRVADIAQRLKISRQAAYKRLRNADKRIKPKKVDKKLCTTAYAKKDFGYKIRLHAEEFNIKILRKSGYYLGLKKRSNTIHIKSHTIRLYKDTIEIYSGTSFYDMDSQGCDRQSVDYWKGIFEFIENELHISILKDRYQNIRRVKAHYSHLDSGIAEECNDKEEKIKIKGTTDKKVWFLVDNSWNLSESETIHPETSKIDMQDVIEPFLNSLRDHAEQTGEIYTFDIIKDVIIEHHKTTKHNTDTINLLTKNVAALAGAMNMLLNTSKQNQSTELAPTEPADYIN